MKYRIHSNIFSFSICMLCILILCVPLRLAAQDVEPDSTPPNIALFLSRNIRPYVEAAGGIRSQLDQMLDADVEVFMLDRYGDKARIDLADRITADGDIDLIVTIGPEAAAFAWEAFSETLFLKMYSIILNPQKVINARDAQSGISLNIPPFNQLSRIRQGFPSLKRIGIFYDPVNNDGFFNEAAGAAATLELDLVPLTVSSKKDIPVRLQQCWQKVDCLWLIPDQTVISETIAQYIIKQAVLQKVPVVGYNKFFYESGAAMAFVFDYEVLGRQAADLAVGLLHDQADGVRIPVFQTWLNKAVLKKLGIEASQPTASQVMFGP